jgi:hypothetical protein
VVRSSRTLVLVGLALCLVLVAPGATPLVTAAGTVGLPAGNWDSLSASGSTLSAYGWAIDPDSRTAPVSMHVYVDGRWGGAVTGNGDRPDVGAVFPGAGNAHGWSYSQSVAPGTHTVCVYAIDVQDLSRNTALGCRTVAVQVTPPAGNWENLSSWGSNLSASGWAMDPDSKTAPVSVHVYVDGRWGAAITASADRPDVGAAFPGAGSAHGWAYSTPVTLGQHSVCVYAIDVENPARNTPLGCRSIQVAITPPIGNIDRAWASYSTLNVSGWAIDPAAPSQPTYVEVLVDGETTLSAEAQDFRPDVGAAFPGAGNAHGFHHLILVSPAVHAVCINALRFQSNLMLRTPLGCRTVAVQVTTPLASLDWLTTSGSKLTVGGWAMDPDAPTASVSVHVYVDGQWGGAVTANGSRPDIEAAFPSAGSAHGFSYTGTLSPGQHSICVYAIDVDNASRHTALGCRDVTVPPVTAAEAIQAAWIASGAENGPLGSSLGSVQGGLTGGGYRQEFQRGAIYWTWATGARRVLSGPVRDDWALRGAEGGELGYPTEDTVCGLVDTGCRQDFENGALYSSAATGVNRVSGPILASWRGAAQDGNLGYPVADAQCGLRDGGCVQEFQEGVIVWSPAAGAWGLLEPVLSAWVNEGAEEGDLGYPVGWVRTEGDWRRGYFQHGQILVHEDGWDQIGVPYQVTLY